MHTDFQNLMQDATRLVRTGDLRGATAAIQAALQGHAGDAPQAPTAGVPGIVIDVVAREIGAPAPARTTGTGDEQSHAASGRTDGESFFRGVHGQGRAAREFKLYVPAHAGDRPRPLVVMLHGCTQDPDDFAAGTRMNDAARAQGFFVLYPAQSPQANPQRCWNWFKHSHQQRGRGEPAILAAMTRHVMQRHGIDASRVYVAGLSAGGAMAAILAATYPDIFSAVGVHSGLAAGAARDLPSALAAMRSGANGAVASAVDGAATRVPTIVFHGDADTTVHPANADHVVRASVDAGEPDAQVERQRAASSRRGYTRRVHRGADGQVTAEHWVVHGSGHAWSGGSERGSYTDPSGPDATAEMIRFFLQQRRV